MRKSQNRLSIFQRAIAAICVMSVLSTTSLFSQESASKKTPKAVQRGAESGAVTPDLPENRALVRPYWCIYVWDSICNGINIKEVMPNESKSTDITGDASAQTRWHVLPPAQQKSKHWVARHPLLTGMLIGAGAGTTYGIIYRLHHSCPSNYDGKPYQGTPWGPYPCPK